MISNIITEISTSSAGDKNLKSGIKEIEENPVDYNAVNDSANHFSSSM